MSTSLDLTNYNKVQQASFVRMVVPSYGVLRFSNHAVPFDITEDDGVAYTYSPMGILLSISEFNNELQPSAGDVTLSMAAIDQSFVGNMMDYALKGSHVTIRRVFFNSDTGVPLNISGNPSKRFSGIIANYSFNDEFNQFSGVATTTVSVSCSSIVKVLEQKLVGQRTNDAERKYNYKGTYVTASLTGGTGFQCRVLTTGATGDIASVGAIDSGSGYTDGTFTSKALTNVAGVGSGAVATIVVSGGGVTSVTITTPGTGYRGDDAGFARVATIVTSNFDFGKPLATA